MTERLEDRIRASLTEGLEGLGERQGDLTAVRRRGARRRVGRRALVVTLVVAVAAPVAVATFHAGAGNDRADDLGPATGQSSAAWEELPDAPVSPRWGAVGVWTGAEALFLGGGVDSPCPPTASCVEPDVMATDGAAYDLDSGTWRVVADAPVPIGYWFRSVYVADRVVLRGTVDDDPVWLSYDPAADRWTTLPRPPQPEVDQGSLSVLDGEVHVLARSGDVLALDPVTGAWRELAGPGLAGAESAVATPDGIFVSGPDPAAPDDGDTPRFTVVDRFDGTTWTRLPTTGQVGTLWHWTGSRLVNTDPQVAPGLAGDPPYGGVLDPVTGAWSPLPNAPDPERGYDARGGWSLAAADGPLVATWSRVYDDRSEEWTLLGRPDDTTVDSGQAAVWADGVLVVFGGFDEETGYASPDGLSNQAWSLSP